MSDMSVQEKIEHYQRSLLKNSSNEERVIHCLKRLKQLPVTVKHLQTTGVGRTVNALRKFPGDCGNLARHLVEEWKQMVSENRSDDEDEACVPDAPEAYKEESSPSPSRLSLDEEKFVLTEDDIHDLPTQQEQHEEEEEEEEEFQQEDFEEKPNFEPVKEEEEKSSTVSSNESRKSKEKKHSEKERHESKSKSHSKDKESSKKRKREEEDETRKKHKSESKEKSSSSKEKSSSGKEKSSNKEEESRKKDKHKDEKKHRSEGKKSSEEKHKSRKQLSSEDEKEKEKEKDKKKSKHREESGKHRKSEKSSSKSKRDSSSDASEKKEKKRDESRKSKKTKLVDPGAGIDCNSGTSFADALGMCSSIPKKRASNQLAKPSKSETSMFAKPSTSSYQPVPKDEVNNAISSLMSNDPEPYEPLSVDLSATLPEISPNYKPLPNVAAKSIQAIRQEEERKLSEALNKKVMQRSRMYTGKVKGGGGYKTVPTLFDICIQSLIENIDYIDYVGGIPYYILKPVLRLATPEQLFKIEQYNPKLAEDTDELWEYHCNKHFKKYCSTRREEELWRELYIRCIEEREARLKGLTEGIKKKIEQAQPVRTAKLAYVDNPVKPPRNVLKNQLKFRTGTEASGINETRKKIIMQSTTGSTNIKVPGTLKKPTSSGPSSAVPKKQKAPLMMKALQLMKQRYKR